LARLAGLAFFCTTLQIEIHAIFRGHNELRSPHPFSYMNRVPPKFDIAKAREQIGKGGRAKWWLRKGTPTRGFRYFDRNGTQINDPEQLERITALVIPPAWKDVRISPRPSSKLQVVGIDTTGRIQYRYHPKFTERKQREKFAKIERFGEHLPELRRVTNEHISMDGFPREKVLAIMMRLINSLYFRVGTDESVRHYKTYGITTLQNKHLEVGRGGKLTFDFVGKSHVRHRKILVDEELASLMRELKALGNSRKLFHYVDEAGNARPVKPAHLNAYLKEATTANFSVKDFRTWGASLLAAIELAEHGVPDTASEIKKHILATVRKVADEIGNTPTVCRISYIHPAVLASYEKGMTLDEFRPRRSRRVKKIGDAFEPEEAALLRLFKNHGFSKELTSYFRISTTAD
jgi:DNA topoisomerase-1